MKRRWLSAVAVAAVLALGDPALGAGSAMAAKPAAKPDTTHFVPAPKITPQQIDAAIASGVSYLWSQQSKKNWRWGDYGAVTKGGPTDQLGGLDVCALTALAYAHETDKPEFQKGLSALRELDVDRTYVLGLRLILHAELYRQADHMEDPVKKVSLKEALRKVMARDVKKLMNFQLDCGGWIYGEAAKASPIFDFSNTQMAVLGLQQASLCGVEFDPKFLTRTRELYLSNQRIDGGWNYQGGETKPSYGSMTAAAVASLMIIRDLLEPNMGCPCVSGRSKYHKDKKLDEAIERGQKWMGGNFPGGGLWGQDYTLYAVERVAIATGFKYIGPHNWYMEGAREVMPTVGHDVPNTMFAMLFLIKGRGPILMNKLQYDGPWDLHCHDLANLTHYMTFQKEQQINWHVINFQIPVEEMHDAPVLFISAEKPFQLTTTEKRKLREFTDTGGTVLFEASCGNQEVDLAWRKTCQEIWPEWEMSILGKGHPLWKKDPGGIAPIPMPLPLWGASDGVRTFLFYAPFDLSCCWNSNNIDKYKGQFDMGCNLWAYTTDRANLQIKPEEIHELGAAPRYRSALVSKGSQGAITVARVRHGGDWNVARNYHEWATLSEATDKLCGLTITEAEPVVPGKAIPAGTTMLYLCGRTSCDLDAAGQEWLKKYLDGGGFLLAEATLGDKRFDKSLRDLVTAAGLTFKKLDAADPLLSGALGNGATGYEIKRVSYTYSLIEERIGFPQPELLGIYLGGKMVGIYSPFDIMYRQTGCAAFDCRGYDDDDARALAVNLALYVSTRAAPAAPAGK